MARVPMPRPDAQPAPEGSYATTADAIWVADARGAFLVRIDVKANRVTSTVAIDPPLLAAGDGEVWMLSPVGGAPGPSSMTLSRVDPQTGVPQPLAEVPPKNSLAVGLGAAWVAGGGITKLDERTGKVIGQLQASALDVQVACRSLWSWVSLNENESRLDRLDANAGERLISIDLAAERPTVVGIGAGCWMVLGDRLFEVDPKAGLTGKRFGPFGSPLLVAGGAVWATDDRGRELGRVDLATGRMIDRWRLPDGIQGAGSGPVDSRLLAAGGSLWLLTESEVLRLSIPAEASG